MTASFIRIALAAILLALPGAPLSAQSFPPLSGRVVDAADILSPADESAITRKLEALERASTRQLVVATVPDLQDRPIEDYGYRLLRHWGIGQKGADNGAILIVAPNERKVRVEVGYGLEPILTDAFSSLTIENRILPRFKAGDFPGGINAGVDALVAQLAAPPEVAEREALEAAARQRGRQQAGKDRNGGGSIFPMIVWAIILFAFINMRLFGGRRRRRGPWGGRRYDGSALPIILWSVANEIGRSRGGGGWGGGGFGGFGGGGGGGGGFSGGGGSGGGGGASGGW